jgi:RimJ/RimL family protein N-acetyltransferase
MGTIKFVRADLQSVRLFVQDLKLGVEHFRYFLSRPIETIHNHLATILIVNELDYPIAYGHLEKEDGILWLGLAVADSYVNQGLGNEMMKKLIDAAKQNNQSSISLSVDKTNLKAQRLYLNHGFQKSSETKNTILYNLKLN